MKAINKIKILLIPISIFISSCSKEEWNTLAVENISIEELPYINPFVDSIQYTTVANSLKVNISTWKINCNVKDMDVLIKQYENEVYMYIETQNDSTDNSEMCKYNIEYTIKGLNYGKYIIRTIVNNAACKANREIIFHLNTSLSFEDI